MRDARRGLTLLEIIVALVIFSLVLMGLANVFTVGRVYLQHSRSRMSAGELGKYYLSPLSLAVRADNYYCTTASVNSLSCGTHDGSPITIDGRDYNYSYNVSDMNPPNGVLRKVKINITWNETNP